MNLEKTLLAAIRACPDDKIGWLALADHLEEQGDARAELLRLTRTLRGEPADPDRQGREQRVRSLLAFGVRPCWPGLSNSVGMRFTLVPAGTFRMGSPDSEAERMPNEGPVHEVEITRPFYLGMFPVTQEQYWIVMGSAPSHFSAKGRRKSQIRGLDTREFPVENVSWHDAVAFCKKLSDLPLETGNKRRYRLPTAAEWEYACRGGLASGPFHFGASLSSTQANFNGRYPYRCSTKGPYLGRTCAVGRYAPNALGLYDMHGNVWEWCSDWFAENYYAASARKDPTGPTTGLRRVLRGGAWSSVASNCRLAYRDNYLPDYRSDYYGCRVVLVLPA